MSDTKQHYAELLNLADGLIDNLSVLVTRMPPPEVTQVNWGHLLAMLEFNRSLSEAGCHLSKQIKIWESKEAENAD